MCRRLDFSKFDYTNMESIYGMYVSTVEKGLAKFQDPVKMTALQDTTAVKKPPNSMKDAARRHAASAAQPATESRNEGRMDSGFDQGQRSVSLRSIWCYQCFRFWW